MHSTGKAEFASIFSGLPGGSNMDGPPLVCPACGTDYLHLTAVQVHQDRQVITITGKALVRRDDAPSSGRGSCVVIEFFCENGHIAQRQYGFWKGRTSAVNVVSEGTATSELWRD